MILLAILAIALVLLAFFFDYQVLKESENILLFGMNPAYLLELLAMLSIGGILGRSTADDLKREVISILVVVLLALSFVSELGINKLIFDNVAVNPLLFLLFIIFFVVGNFWFL